MPQPFDPRALAGRVARLRRAVRRTVLSRRRPLAALCAGLAAVGGVRAWHPPPTATVPVVVAARDLASGTTLTSRDLAVRRYPAAVAPGGATLRALGRTLAGPVTQGEPITGVRLVAPSLLSGYPGLVALPVRLSDADAASLLRAGDHVDLVAADARRGTATYIAVDVAVLSLTPPGAGEQAAGTPGRLVVVAVPPSDVVAIAGAAATDLLSAVISR
ncbi:MAG TPA: SAF domain-containing protein [Nocardioides sp.]|jgi:Flp pilus assembly protein CpaB|uniref:SAF domain-containing protein n=1 Tax=Nocardioides sp. TaxID=35761 RepID=UPI002E2F87F2|nr:SAF domain-containing protein [Nocardioides sp.]HEX3932155.1 SAF domain-containing protein [Nocardioides sp.]